MKDKLKEELQKYNQHYSWFVFSSWFTTLIILQTVVFDIYNNWQWSGESISNALE